MPPDSAPVPPAVASSAERGRRWETVFVTLALFIIGLAYYFAIPAESRVSSRIPQGYYGLLTEAFLAGQLHLKIEPDPRLVALDNPYAGPQGANRPHDMSYYRGRFYLYYGATPVLLLYLPWRLLTGHYLGEALGGTLLLYGGVTLSVLMFLAARRRWFPALSTGWVLLLILVLGFSPPLFSEATNNTFYGVPIAGAFFCLMAAVAAADRAVAAPTAGGQAGWLATASLAWGLAVGARPIYVLGLAVLAGPAAYLWWNCESKWRWPGMRLLAATLLPATLIGLALMAYNYLRFDDPFDFGIRYSMASGDLREARLVGSEFIGKNLTLYLTEAMSFIRYYPFIIPDANAWGLLPHLPFSLLGLLFPLTWLHRPLREARWVLGGLLLAGAAMANFGLLCLFFGEQERYLLDFVPPLLLLAVLTALALLGSAPRLISRLAARILQVLIAGLGAYAIATGAFLALPRHAMTSNMPRLERLLNIPTHLVERSLGTEHGPLMLEVKFPRNRAGITEPLVTTGHGSTNGDSIAVRYLDAEHVQFQAFHVGRGGPVSEPIKIDYDMPHRLRIVLGSLYPPRGHPHFAAWPMSQVENLRRRLRVELDGQTVLQGNFPVYASTPAATQIARSDLAADISSPRFTGQILSVRRLGIEAAEAAGYERDDGPVRLTVRFPSRVGDEGLPLVSTGRSGRGDLIFAQLLEGGRVRFGHDSFGAGAALAPTVSYDPTVDQIVEIEMGSLYPPEWSGASHLRERLRIAFNDMPLIDTVRPFHPAGSGNVEFGFNTIGASTAIEYFPGAVRKIERVAAKPVTAIRESGRLLRLTVVFPDDMTPRAEPLVVAGRAGEADVLFVRYESAHSVRFGHDHWGFGATLGDPVRVDPGEAHLLEIRGGALAGHGEPAGFEVWCDGHAVFRSTYAAFVSAPGDFFIGENRIGASSCQPLFTGRFLLKERLP